MDDSAEARHRSPGAKARNPSASRTRAEWLQHEKSCRSRHGSGWNHPRADTAQCHPKSTTPNDRISHSAAERWRRQPRRRHRPHRAEHKWRRDKLAGATYLSDRVTHFARMRAATAGYSANSLPAIFVRLKPDSTRQTASIEAWSRMGTSSSRVAQLIDPAGAYRSVAPVHHRRDCDSAIQRNS